MSRRWLLKNLERVTEIPSSENALLPKNQVYEYLGNPYYELKGRNILKVRLNLGASMRENDK